MNRHQHPPVRSKLTPDELSTASWGAALCSRLTFHKETWAEAWERKLDEDLSQAVAASIDRLRVRLEELGL